MSLVGKIQAPATELNLLSVLRVWHYKNAPKNDKYAPVTRYSERSLEIPLKSD